MCSHKLENSTCLSGLHLVILAGLILASSCTALNSPPPDKNILTPVQPSAQSDSTQQPAPTRTNIPTVEPGPYQVQKAADIAYTSRLKLDIYSPAEIGPWPVVVVYHGGLGTTKDAMRRLSTAVASHGAVVFVPNWRTVLSTELERGAEDAACAVRFARAHANEYGGEPDRITGAGHSAGATIAALTGLVGDEFSGDCLVGEGSGYLDAVAAIEGPYDMINFSKSMYAYENAPPEMWERLSPIIYPAVLPPRDGMEFHIFISDLMNDEAQADTAAFYARLEEAGYAASLTVVPGIRHANFDSALPETVNAIIDMARRQAALP